MLQPKHRQARGEGSEDDLEKRVSSPDHGERKREEQKMESFDGGFSHKKWRAYGQWRSQKF